MVVEPCTVTLLYCTVTACGKTSGEFPVTASTAVMGKQPAPLQTGVLSTRSFTGVVLLPATGSVKAGPLVLTVGTILKVPMRTGVIEKEMVPVLPEVMLPPVQVM